MNAIAVHPNGSTPPRLTWESAPDPTFGPDEVLVDIVATAINRADLLQARGGYPPPPGASPILGLELAGQIAALGANVTGWQIGDRVCALLAGGGYASQAAVHAKMLLKLPDSWDFAQGAAVPEVWYTAFVNLFLEGGLEAGETVLIHAGGSGVGTAAIQLTRAAGATPFVTAGAPFKLDGAVELGAALAINYRSQDFVDEVMAATGGRGVDLILDPVGAGYLDRNLRALAHRGRLIHIGLLSGSRAEIDLGLVMGKMARLVGSRLRGRPLAEKIEITRQFAERFWPLFNDGTLKPIIDRSFPITAAEEAHRYVSENKNFGKVILVVREG